MIYKHTIPGVHYKKLFTTFNFTDITNQETQKALQGPTQDFEDNLQLHSAMANNCSLILTRDKKLLKLGYFGKALIAGCCSEADA